MLVILKFIKNKSYFIYFKSIVLLLIKIQIQNLTKLLENYNTSITKPNTIKIILHFFVYREK